MLSRDMFRNETVHILGGGPSIADLDITRLEHDPVIAVNNAGLDVFPDADILLVMDERWLRWNHDRLHLNHSGVRVIRQFQVPRRLKMPWPYIEIGHDKFGEFSWSLDRLAGPCGGAMAINLAALTGASRIILHGFEMHPGHYHNDHQVETNAHLYRDAFIPAIERMAAHLTGRVEVINATPNSALTCFPTEETSPP